MRPETLVTTIVIGGMFIALGLVPRLLAGLKDRIQNFSDLLLYRNPTHTADQSDYESLPRHPGLAGFGAAVIVLSLLAYISR